MVISVEGSGRPIVPVNSLEVNLLAVATGEVSERPYPSVMPQPVTCFQRSATTRCTAMPPASVRISGLKSSLRKSSLLSSALNSVFSPGKMWIGYFFSSLTKPGMSRGLGIMMLCAPCCTPISAFTVSAKI